MSKRITFISAIAILVIAAGGIAWWYFGKSQHATFSKEETDPFANIVIPEKFDEATRRVLAEHVSTTKAAYEKNPAAWEVWIFIGNMRRMLEDYDGAIAAYQKSLELQGNNILGYRNIAEVYNMNLQDYERAESYYRQAISNNFSDIELYLTLGQMLHRKMGKTEEAEKTYIDGLRRSNFNPELLIALIEFYKSTGNTEKYKENVALLLQQHPDNELYKRNYSNVLTQ